jgi:hypothetical protein
MARTFPADTEGDMFRLLRLISLVCCAFVLVSFLLFAIAQTSTASKGQANAISSGTIAGPSSKNKPISKEHQPRRFIDQVTQKLNSPFTGIVSTNDIWIKHLIPTFFSLLVYGFALGFLARLFGGRTT